MNTRLELTLFSALLFAACSGEAHPAGAHVHADGTVHDPAKPAGAHADHGPEHPLGEVALAGQKVQIVLLGDAEPGKEADIDVRFAAGAQRPETLRAWIGVESGQGSMKTRFANEGATTMHGHVAVPKPLPDGSKLWFEVELDAGPSRASIGLKK